MNHLDPCPSRPKTLGMILNVFIGTAAELIKLHPLITRARARGWTTRLFATGQSSTNLDAQVDDFGLDPAELIWLRPRRPDLATAGAALRWFARVNFARPPVSIAGEYALVHGDTLSTLAAARVARRAGARVVHVEAGLRSRALFDPFPEEILRRRVSRLAHVHCAPDRTAVDALTAARVGGAVIDTGGNTLIDAVRDAAGTDEPKGFALVNVHRFENLRSDARWSRIVDAVLTAAAATRVIFVAPPPTRRRLESDAPAAARMRAAGVEVVDRVPFSKFIGWLKAAEYLISDGGSNQEECSYLGVPCLLLRDQTERREGLDANCVLSRFDRDVIARFLGAPQTYRRPPLDADAAPSAVILDWLAAHP